MVVLYVLITVIVIIGFISLYLLVKKTDKKNPHEKEALSNIEKQNDKIRSDIMQTIQNSQTSQFELLQNLQKSESESMLAMQNMLRDSTEKQNNAISGQMDKIFSFQKEQAQKAQLSQTQQFTSLTKSNMSQQKELIEILNSGLSEMQSSNEKKLDKISNVVNEKLDKTLNERIDSSFKQISDQLSELYKTLGELSGLSSGVDDLNKTLSNVKTRGTWGEIQLESILEQTMTKSQYDTNIPTKKNSNDRVEFAVKIPTKDDCSSFMYLPIDAKMPSDIYNKIVDASMSGDKKEIQSASKELESRIKQEARTIRDKYISPPETTDFAIMFLPTEGLYCEALRIDGLSQWCQTNCKIIISGPTTITALLNSLRISFSNVALTKKSQEVLKLLQSIKSQYQTFSELIEKTQKKLHDAVVSTDALKNRTDIIQRKMSGVEEIEEKEAKNLLSD